MKPLTLAINIINCHKIIISIKFTISSFTCFAEPYSSSVLKELELKQRKNEHSKGHQNSSMTMWDKTKKILDDFYQPYNAELADLLGDNKFLWL